MNTEDKSKINALESKHSNDFSSVFNQSLIPLSMIFAEAGKVEALITVGRLMLAPALVVSAVVVLASLPLVQAWDRYKFSSNESQQSKNNTNEHSNLGEESPIVNNLSSPDRTLLTPKEHSEKDESDPTVLSQKIKRRK